MLNAIDHADADYVDELSPTGQYVIQHYGKKLDEAIRSGSQIECSYSTQRLHLALQPVAESDVPDFWKPVEEWELD